MGSRGKMENFFLQEAYPFYLEHHTKVKKDIFEKKDTYAKILVENAHHLCEKIKSIQQQGKKQKIQSLHLSTLYTAIQLKHGQFIIEAYDEKGYNDLEAIEFSYSMMPYLNSLLIFKEELLTRSKRYMNSNLKGEIEKLIVTYFAQYSYYFIQLVRYALDQILELESLKTLQRTENFYIVAGEYRDIGEIIYRTENTYSSNPKALLHIDQVDEKKAYSFFQKGLNVENKDYTYYDFRNSYFSEAHFQEVKLEKALLSSVCFKESYLENVSFSGSILHDVNFKKALLQRICMDYVYADIRNVEGLQIQPGCIGMQCVESKWQEVSCLHSILCGADFRRSSFTQCKFEKSDLSYSDFRGCTFKDVSFKETRLFQCVFDQSALETLSLTKVQLMEIKGV